MALHLCLYVSLGADYMNRIKLQQCEVGSTLIDYYELDAYMRGRGWMFAEMLGIVSIDSITRQRKAFYE